MDKYNLKPFWICSGISAGIGIVLGLIALIATSDFGKSHKNDNLIESSTSIESEESSDVSAEEIQMAEPEKVTTAPYVHDSFSVSLSGPIANNYMKIFEFTFNPDENPNITGRDSYNGQSFLHLEGNYDPDADRIVISETYDGKVTGTITGKLYYDRTDGTATLSGTFTNYKNDSYVIEFTGTIQ